MNTDNNMLYESEEAAQEELKNMFEHIDQIPDHLTLAAQMKLAGERQAQVSFNSGGKLSKFAAQKRKERKTTKK